MGDSMTDPNGGSNKPANWTTLLESKLEARFKSPVTVVNVGKASTKLPDSMAAIATWSAMTPEPDLVLFCYGYNDWFAGTRGAAFQSQGEYAVKAIRRATKDKADVLIMTTIPTLNHWETMAELAEAGRRAAKATDAGLADLWQAFHQAIPDAAERPPYYAADKIHFSPLGHELAAQTAFDAIAAASSTAKAPSLPAAAPTPAKRRVASDEWIDVVPLIDPALDKYDIPNLTGKNEWRIENGELVAAAEGKPCKLLLPLDLDGMSSEVEAEFTRTSGTKGFNFDVPVASGPCPLHFDRDGDGRALLGKTGIPLGGKVSIETGKRGTIRMVVRRANGVDEVEAWFNGASLGKWTGNRNDIAMNRQEGYPHDRRLSMWIFGDPFVFHRIRARMLDGGTAETLRPVTIPAAVGAIVAP
jgi:lysophospholipase L1-like esterase